MLLIGGGGNNSGVTPGGAGTTTVWFGAANNVPNNLVVTVSTGDSSNTSISYLGSNGLNTLLVAEGAISNNGGTNSVKNNFGASGFFNTYFGQDGGSAGYNSFVSAGTASGTRNGAYGYATTKDAIFFLQPFVVGVGAANTGDARSAIGCGAGGSGGDGGPGLVIIASI